MSKKLSVKQKLIKRVTKRLQTKERHNIGLKIVPTEQNVEDIINANIAAGEITGLNDDTVTEWANKIVKAETRIDRQEAKDIKKHLGLKKISDVQALTGNELATKIAQLYDDGKLKEKQEVLNAYGYK